MIWKIVCRNGMREYVVADNYADVHHYVTQREYAVLSIEGLQGRVTDIRPTVSHKELWGLPRTAWIRGIVSQITIPARDGKDRHMLIAVDDSLRKGEIQMVDDNDRILLRVVGLQEGEE